MDRTEKKGEELRFQGEKVYGQNKEPWGAQP